VKRRIVLLGAAALGCIAAPAMGQEPDEQTPAIAYGEAVNGALAPTGDTLSDGSFYRDYVLTGNEGDVVTITLSSGDFNANLLLLDQMENLIARDDNSGGSCNSHLTTALPATGWYFIVANANSPNEIGNFELSLQEGEHAPAGSEPCRGFTDPRGVLQPGDTVYGEIGAEDPMFVDDSTNYQVWVMAPMMGQTVSVDLVSSEFDAALYLVRGMSEVVTANDDGGGGCHARMVFTAEEDRPYRLLTQALPGGASGSFLLALSDGAKPVLQKSTCEPPGQ
jgi:serine protease Do